MTTDNATLDYWTKKQPDHPAASFWMPFCWEEAGPVLQGRSRKLYRYRGIHGNVTLDEQDQVYSDDWPPLPHFAYWWLRVGDVVLTDMVQQEISNFRDTQIRLYLDLGYTPGRLANPKQFFQRFHTKISEASLSETDNRYWSGEGEVRVPFYFEKLDQKGTFPLNLDADRWQKQGTLQPLRLVEKVPW